MTEAPSPELAALYEAIERENLKPLWTEIGNLMPTQPLPRAAAHVWRWDRLLALAQDAGRLVPVGRGGERRAIALVNPHLGGRPYATNTLWAAIQYLMPGEDAPEHRHTQNAFRFGVEGQGVWTVVNGDPIAMRRGDFLPQAGWHWHAHHNATPEPMAWLDGLDIPFQYETETTFFEFGREKLSSTERTTPTRSRSEHLWGYPGLRPVSLPSASPFSPLLAFRWADTDAALTDQLTLDAAGHPGVVEPGHAAVRYMNPSSGQDVLPTIRAEMHRIVTGVETNPIREVGSSVYQVFDGSGTVRVGDSSWRVSRGDLFTVPSWQPLVVRSEAGTDDSDSGALDLFRFSDTPIFDKLHLHRSSTEGPA